MEVEFTITWDDSSTTDIEGTGTYTNGLGQSVYTTIGEAVDGDTFLEVITETTLNLLACATTGVTSQTGLGVVTFN